MEVRPLDPTDADDHRQSQVLGREAFGELRSGSTPPSIPPPPATAPSGVHGWGVWDGDRLVARAVWHEYESWFGGRRVPTAGVAGVTVAAEHRGSGLLRPLFEALWGDARAAGYAVSTLFPTANGIYRSLGYEVIASYDTVRIPVAELGRLSAPASTPLATRRAESADLPAVHDVYRQWAAAQNGPLTRTGPLFEPAAAALLDAVTGVTLAVGSDGRVRGYLSWSRGPGYGPDRVLEVEDLVAVDADAYRALWAVVAGFGSVVGTVRLATSGADPARLVLGTSTWDVVDRHPYALRVLDDVAFTDRGVGLGDTALSAQGRALLYAGAQTCANLRMLGHLTGPADRDDELDRALCGRPLHVRDYF